MSLEIVTLTDPSGSTAQVLTGFGFNCFRFTPMVDGRPLDVLYSAPNFEKGTERASHSGIPILFPFPGRLRGMSFTYHGKTWHPTNLDDKQGNAIHGFVLNRAWEVIQQTRQRVVGRFQASRVDANLLDQWPADFVLIVAYELAGATLQCDITVENPSGENLPFGLGLHPYFRVPLVPGGAADACRITVPASGHWKMESLLPTGEAHPVSGRFDLRGGQLFADARYDDMFTQLAFANGWCHTFLVDPSGRRLRLSFDRSFRECVVFNPPHRQAICIEPYTCVPDAFSLTSKGIDAGLQVMSPGDAFHARWEIGVD
jgi:aldose 1-epimerase